MLRSLFVRIRSQRVLLALFLFLSLYSGALYAFATTYVTPGTVLDPAGLPGAYTVGPLLSYGGAVTTGHDNEILYTDSSGNLASDSLFTRSSTGATNIEMTQGSNYAALQIGTVLPQFGGLDGVGLVQGDSAQTSIYTFMGIADATGLGAAPGTVVISANDLVSGSNSLLFFTYASAGLTVDDGLGTTASFVVEPSGITFHFNNGSSGYTFPTSDGGSGQVLTTDGSGGLSWASIGGSSGFTIDGNYNMFAGTNSGSSLSSGSLNLFIGEDAGQDTDSSENTIIGQYAGTATMTGGVNTFIGHASGNRNEAGSENTFVGADSGWNNTDGSYNTFIGRGSGNQNTTGYENTFLGTNAGYNNTTGYYNTFIGKDAGNNNTEGYQNVFLGRGTGQTNTTGNNNTFLGYWSGQDLTTGSENISIGMNSAQGLTTGSGNIIIGYNTTASSSVEGSILIGNNLNTSSANKAINIGNIFSGNYDPSGLNGMFATIGDYYNLGNSTVLFVDDLNQKISFYFGSDSYTFPSTDGSSDQVLKTDGSGNLSWATVSGGSGWGLTGNAGTNSSTNFIGTTDSQSLAFKTNGEYVMTFSPTKIVNLGDVEGLANSTQFYLNDTNRTVGFGDVSNAFNNTNLLLDDVNQKILLTIDDAMAMDYSTSFLFNSNSIRYDLQSSIDVSSYLSMVSGVFSVGYQDTFSMINNQLYFNGSNGNFSVGGSTVVGMAINGPSSTISIGDTSSIGNTTLLYINDATQAVSIYALNGLTIDDNNGNNCTITPTGGSTCTSDERLKKDIVDLPSNTLDNLQNLRTVTFNWLNGPEKTSIGFIAQNVEQYYPELVSELPNGYLGVNYAGMTPVLVEAVKELNIKIDSVAELSDSSTILNSLRSWFGDMGNGIESLWAKVVRSERVETEQLCVGSTCVSEGELQQLLDLRNQSMGGSQIVITSTNNQVPDNNQESGGDAGTTSNENGQTTEDQTPDSNQSSGTLVDEGASE